MAEQGFPINLESWYGVFAPNGTPRPIIDRLNSEIGKIVGSPATQERFKQLNLASTPNLSPEEFSQYIQQERKNWSRVINENNIHPE